MQVWSQICSNAPPMPNLGPCSTVVPGLQQHATVVPKLQQSTTAVLGLQQRTATVPELHPCTAEVPDSQHCTTVVPTPSLCWVVKGHQSMAPLSGIVTCWHGFLPSQKVVLRERDFPATSRVGGEALGSLFGQIAGHSCMGSGNNGLQIHCCCPKLTHPQTLCHWYPCGRNTTHLAIHRCHAKMSCLEGEAHILGIARCKVRTMWSEVCTVMLYVFIAVVWCGAVGWAGVEEERH